VSEFVHWLDSWLLEIPELDKEHRELVDLLNRLVHCQCPNAPRQGDSPAPDRDGIAMLQELGLHVKRHFKHEEAFMREAGYPRYEDHRYEHMTLLAEFSELLREVKSTGLQCLDQRTLASLKSWLISHIAGADRRFGEYHRGLRSGAMGHGQDRFDRYWTRRAGEH